MQKKRKPRPRLNSLLLWASWIAWSTIAWVIVGSVVASDGFGALSPDAQVLVVFGSAGLLLSPGQAFLLRRWFGKTAVGWIPVSIIVWLLSSSVIFAFFRDWLQTTQGTQLVLGLIFTIPAFVQSLLLRRHVGQSLLWTLTGAVSGILFTLPLLALGGLLGSTPEIALGAGGALVGIVQALVLRWMLRAPPPATPQQTQQSTAQTRASATDSAADTTAAGQRLTLHEATVSSEAIDQTTERLEKQENASHDQG